MKIDLQTPDSWAQLGEGYKQALPFADDPKVAVQVYLGINHALYEIGQALAQTFPHRRTILYDQNAGPEFEPIVLAFAKEAFASRALELADMQDPQRWLEATQKDAIFMLSAFDDPATGEVFNYPEVETQLKDKRFFRVRISHSYHQNFTLPKPSSYEIHIYSVAPDRAVAVLGERAKLIPTIAPSLQWPTAIESEIKSDLTVTSADLQAKRKAVVEKFESLIASANIWPQAAERLWDRAILSYSDVEGLSLIEELNKILPGGSLDSAPANLQTLSLCQWQDLRQMAWLQKRGITLEALRGSILISADLLIEKGAEAMALAVKQAHDNLLKRQLGN